MSQHIVLKRINGPGGKVYMPGDVVDTSSWVWERQLVEQRRLKPVHEEDAPAPLNTRRFASSRMAKLKDLPVARRMNKEQPTAG